ncbi:MAG: hypothetical protein DI563_00765 [Variovorax paradoxus]|uniref:Uncharacterized protein n=1 Tax=Variovorax paradoxus TaxID=34073 RepID=A0A2W5QIG4_VARPD|nr:MAG: hypothetical protein DI563_00765 [Variovorax paradoxus]
MRITNKGYTPIEVFAEIINAFPATAADTKRFFAEERVSHDWLVEEFANKVNVMLDSFRRYGTEVSPTQSVRDNGVDVRLVFPKGDMEEYRVGFQLKSENEANKDALRRKNKSREETMISTLKRQAYEAEHMAGVHEWWIATCFDLEKHRGLVDSINAELIPKSASGKEKVRLIRPNQAYTLLSMDNEMIDALCTLFLCEEDEVITRAREDVLRLLPLSVVLIAHTLYAGFEGSREVTLNQLHALAGDGYTFEEKTRAMNELESVGYLSENGAGASYNINPTVMLGVSALYFEARVRHDYGQHDVGDFVYRLVTLMPV